MVQSTLDKVGAYDAIDAVRTLAAIAVVWNHTWNMMAGAMPPGAPWYVHCIYISAGFGQDAVFVFFVISGYWIARSTLGKIHEDSWRWDDYLVDRLARLWIVVMPALAIGAVLDCIGRWALDLPLYRAMTVTGDAPFDVGSRVDLPHAIANLAFVQNTLLPPFGSNVPLWSLAYEFWYYVWFPVIALALLRRQASPMMTIGAIATALVFTAYARAFPIWLLGAGVAFFARTFAPEPRTVGPWAVPMGLAVFAGAEIAVHMLDLGFIAAGLTVGVGFAVLLSALLARPVAWPKGLSPLSRYGAGSSFSLYAAHFPVLALLVAATPRIEGFFFRLLTSLVVTALLIAWGYLFSRLTEAHTKRLRTLMRRWIGRGRDTKTRTAR